MNIFFKGLEKRCPSFVTVTVTFQKERFTVLTVRKFEPSNWKLRVCSCGSWCKHLFEPYNCCVSKDRVS